MFVPHITYYIKNGLRFFLSPTHLYFTATKACTFLIITINSPPRTQKLNKFLSTFYLNI